MRESDFDPESGIESSYTRESSLRKDVAQLQAEASAFASLLSSPGWKLLSTFIQETVAAETNQLITTRDQDEMRRLQESIQALERIRTYPEARIYEAQEKALLLSEADPSALSPDPSDDPTDNH
jgi:hypothetical protein